MLALQEEHQILLTMLDEVILLQTQDTAQEDQTLETHTIQILDLTQERILLIEHIPLIGLVHQHQQEPLAQQGLPQREHTLQAGHHQDLLTVVVDVLLEVEQDLLVAVVDVEGVNPYRLN